MTKHTNTDPLDKALDWNMHMLLREAIIQNVSENKHIHITQEMIDEAKSAAKQAINNYINSRVETLQLSLDEERKKFQQETLRSSKPLKPLFEMARVFASDSHNGWHPRCARCEVYREATEALKNTVYFAELNQAKGEQ